MSAAEVLHQIEAAGARVVMPEPGRLRLIGSDDARAKVKALVLEHKAAIINELNGRASALPAHVRAGLSLGGYELPAWTREACKLFLDQLQAEWPGFKVNGWHGLAMPESWPVGFMDAVQSVYVLSLQESTDATQAQGRGLGRIGQKNAARGILAQNIQHGGE
ncbi:MAG: hypothetical protein EOL86_09465 [Deltaproteobacteria bacterium]|nr:hypothetical protein [Deltaproteobacteria bacterium]